MKTALLLLITIFAFAIDIAWARPPKLKRISLSTTKSDPDSNSVSPFISANGKFVTFYSSASNLVENDTEGRDDVFLYDIKKKLITRISQTSSGAGGNADSYVSKISKTGRYILFSSASSNLASGATNGHQQGFIYDRNLGAIQLISLSNSSIQAQEASGAHDISNNGRYVLFFSDDDNLVEGDSNGYRDVFLRDTVQNTTIRISGTRPGVSTSDCFANDQSISKGSEPRYFLFICTNTGLGNDSSVFRYDRTTGESVLASVDENGNQAIGFHNRALLSANGRYVVFHSTAALVAGDTNDHLDVYIRDMKKNTTKLVVYGLNKEFPNSFITLRSMTPDTRYLTFVSNATNLIASGGSNFTEAYRYDRKRRKAVRLSVGIEKQAANEDSGWVTISADGKRVVFQSDASNLASGDNNLSTDIFLSQYAAK